MQDTCEIEVCFKTFLYKHAIYLMRLGYNFWLLRKVSLNFVQKYKHYFYIILIHTFFERRNLVYAI